MDQRRAASGGGIILLLLIAPMTALGADDPNLVGWWALDEGSGTVALDSSGYGNDAVFQGDPQWVPDGRFGGAVQFNGTSDYLAAPDSESLDINGDQLTLAAWVNGTSWATSHFIRKIPDTGTGSIYMIRVQSNALRAIFSTSAGELVVQGVTPPVTGEWMHMAFVYDGAEARIYVNGAVDGRGNISGDVVESDNELRIGRGEPAGYFNGSIDDVRVYNRALTDEEIKALDPPKLQAYGPTPADGDRAVAAPLFQWTAGETAVLHDVYLGTNPDLGPADLVSSRSPLALYYHTPGLQPGTTYYWRVDEIEVDLTTVHTGNVWSFTTQAATAYQPSPADGDGNVAPAVTLAWLPGKNALQHHVYFGDNRDAVAQGAADADQGTQKETTFAPTDLAEATTYYWRVDEILIDGSTKAGSVWTFSTFLAVDDFENYTDQPGEEIFAAWIDGFTNGLSGSTVGYLMASNGTFGETRIVHSGGQSMPLDYNNVKTPYYSEVEREFSPAQDWTVNDSSLLVLYVRGMSSNGADPLYAAVEDSAKHVGIVTHSDPAVATTGRWTEWKVPLSDLTAAGVDLNRVQKLYLGLGDRQKPAAGGAGRIYIDDIRVIRAAAAQ
jgi:hypothetical protein